jgi:hypothetical protein
MNGGGQKFDLSQSGQATAVSKIGGNIWRVMDERSLITAFTEPRLPVSSSLGGLQMASFSGVVR